MWLLNAAVVAVTVAVALWLLLLYAIAVTVGVLAISVVYVYHCSHAGIAAGLFPLYGINRQNM